MDCVSIQQREFPACRAEVLGSGDHLVGHLGLPAWLLGCEQAGEENKEGMGHCVQDIIHCTDCHDAYFVHTMKRQEL